MTGLKRTAARILAAAAIMVLAVTIAIAACGNPHIDGILGEPGGLPAEQPGEDEQPDEDEQPSAPAAVRLTITGTDFGLYTADAYRYTESVLSDLSNFAVWQKAADNSSLAAFGLAEGEGGAVSVRLYTPSGADFTASGTFLVKVTREDTQTARYGIVRFISGRSAVNWTQMSAVPTVPVIPDKPAAPAEPETPPDLSTAKTFAATVSAIEKSAGSSEAAYTLADGFEYYRSSLVLTAAKSPASVVIDGGGRTVAGITNGITVGAGLTLTLRNITFSNIPFTVAADGVLVLDADAVVRNNWTGVTVNGGTLEMNAGALVTASSGSGVRMERSGGVFTMNGGEISGNTSDDNGGGVRMRGSSGVFTMNGGEIRGNTARDSGGGVYAESPSNTFNMTGGVITHNTAGTDGGGAFLSGTFFSGNPQIGGITTPPDGRGWIYDNYPNDMVNVQ